MQRFLHPGHCQGRGQIQGRGQNQGHGQIQGRGQNQGHGQTVTVPNFKNDSCIYKRPTVSTFGIGHNRGNMVNCGV